jgi:hypothetical protein
MATSAPAAALPPWEQVVRVAAAQRLLIWIFFAGLLAFPLSLQVGLGEKITKLLLVAIVLIVRVAMAAAVYRVAAALGSKVAVVWAIGGFLPSIIGLIVKATRFLRTAGLKPGFMGTRVPSDPPPGYGTEALGQIFS